jgi:hypothetical protein
MSLGYHTCNISSNAVCILNENSEKLWHNGMK